MKHSFVLLYIRFAFFASESAGMADRFKAFPPWLGTMFIAMLPIFELRGAIPAAKLLWDMSAWEAFIFAVPGNMIPIPFILLLLDPVSKWLMEKSKIMNKFFTWLFNRTRRRHTTGFDKWKEMALIVFVAIPLPITGAWTGAVAAFLFDIPFWKSLLFIFLGVCIAGVIVSAVTAAGQAIGLQLSLILIVIMVLLLSVLYALASREKEDVEG